jgi:hypothetical protein
MASNSVNVPTNPKIKEQDVNAKLQLYGIYSGMSPPNAAFAPRNRRIMMELPANTHSQHLPMAKSLRSVQSRQGAAKSSLAQY